MQPDRAPNAPAAPLGDWGDFAPAPTAAPLEPLEPLEAELVEQLSAAEIEDEAFRSLVDEIEGLPPLDAIEVTDPPAADAAARALIDEIEGPPVAPAPKVRPRAMPVARPVPAPTPAPEPEPESPFPQLVGCPRCGEKVEPVESRCPWCAKWLVGSPPPKPKREEPDEADEPVWYGESADESAAERAERRRRTERPPYPPLVVVFVAYGILLASLIVLSAFATARGFTEQSELNGTMFVVGLFDAAVTGVALALVWRTAQQPAPGGALIPMWVLALPMLALLLFLNISYITFLRELFRPFGAAQPEKLNVTFATVLLICIMPAVMEEVFFRQLALGVFRRSMSLHAAVWLVALLFALAHLANPLGMPYLFIAGAAFGYARAYGGLTLAILLHFLHNFAVVAYEAWK
jgi:uncharacterized protein